MAKKSIGWIPTTRYGQTALGLFIGGLIYFLLTAFSLLPLGSSIVVFFVLAGTVLISLAVFKYKDRAILTWVTLVVTYLFMLFWMVMFVGTVLLFLL